MTDDSAQPIDPIRSLSAEIIGADEEQIARVARPIPPLPPLPLASRIGLWMLFLLSLGEAVYYFTDGGFWKGFFGIIGAGAAAAIRWAMLDGFRQSRWSNPEFRNRQLDAQRRIEAADPRSADS